MAVGRLTICLTILFVIGAALAPTRAMAVTDGEIGRFVELSDRFNAKLPRHTFSGFSDDQKRARATCILMGFEGRFGSEGVSALMDLMSVLARGAQFDDPTIVSFNGRFGSVYDSLVDQCTRRARSS